MAHICDSQHLEAETEELLEVLGQCGLQNKSLSQPFFHSKNIYI